MMKKIVALFLSIFPLFAVAASNSSLSFAPPPSDFSVVFLGDLFGVVDGVLSGTGSQMFGTMFGVFNSAVLALGGIIIIYTLLVSTMNTAESGKMLGEKWSSIWVPLRATLGLALLIPKASGYCLMQIFVMWIVLQGVGAADKVWSAALSYLNRGGLIVQTQMNPALSMIAGGSSVAVGASTILAGQVCMVALQQFLEAQKQANTDALNDNGGPCYGSPSIEMAPFCANNVPDFLSSVNAVAAQTANPNPTGGIYSVSMPQFEAGTPYAPLNGICGTLTWNVFSSSQMGTIQGYTNTLSQSETETVKMSRAIAIQQMYIDLAPIAQVMVNNDRQLKNQPPAENDYSSVAVEQFGVPYLNTGQACSTITPDCNEWGQDPSSSNKSTPLYKGTEFQGAIADYNGIMAPTINLYNEAKSNQGKDNFRGFIQQAQSNGWILAGSYFFNLAMLNSAGINSSTETDNDSGLDGSTFDPGLAPSAFNNGQCAGPYASLCYWLNKSPTLVTNMISLINGSSILSAPLPVPTTATLNPSSPNYASKTGIQSSTVFGFVNNSLMVTLPGQPGQAPPPFAIKFNISINVGQYMLPKESFPCGKVVITFFSFCLGSLMGEIFYNLILRNLFNLFLSILAPFINVFLTAVLAAPLTAISEIFLQNVAIIEQPSVNPIVALANMGANYINFSNELWILLVGLSATPIIIVIFPLMVMILPLLLVWVGIMVGIGFLTAYYIPFLPYMIFTFGSIAWLMAVIEAMVAAPIVALGVTHPEGHEAFGKGENAVMILLNVFLRPSMMIIGFIAGIALSYVAVWIINAGFANAEAFIQGTASGIQWNSSYTNNLSTGSATATAFSQANSFASMGTGYSSWAGIYGFFFCVLIYTVMYLTAVQKSFTLISYLPDQVLRWIGGGPESFGEKSAQWADEPKQQVESGGKATGQASSQRDQQLGGYYAKGMGWLKGKTSGQGQSNVSSTGVDSSAS